MIAHPRSRAGLTLIQLVALIAVTGILFAFLFSLCSNYRERCGPRPCISNLRQLGLSMMMYAQDYDECYPSYRRESTSDWSVEARGVDGQTVHPLWNSSPWVAQLLPYVRDPGVFRCPQDADPQRTRTSAAVSGSATPFPVSYGPNRLFANPSAYGRKRPVTQASVVRPEERYLLADCVTASGFDLDTIAGVRYANYDPSLRQNGWSPAQFTAMGRVAWPDARAASVTRHRLGSNMVFADGHVEWLRHDQIPNNDGPSGRQYQALKQRVVPWQPMADDP